MGVEFLDYLICGGSNNADRKGEYEGKGSCEHIEVPEMAFELPFSRRCRGKGRLVMSWLEAHETTRKVCPSRSSLGMSF